MRLTPLRELPKMSVCTSRETEWPLGPTNEPKQISQTSQGFPTVRIEKTFVLGNATIKPNRKERLRKNGQGAVLWRD